jgi:SAM-dependent methyltransferase
MVDTIGLPVGARCLDVGCGPGFATVALADRGYSVDAIDTTSFMLERTRERAAGAQLSARVTARRGDVHALDFPDGSFDLVLLVGVTEWLPDLDGPLREIVRVLKHDGHLVVTCDNRWALANVMDPMLNPALAPARHAIRRWLTGSGWSSAPGIRTTDYSIAGFDRALNAAGLVPVERSTVGFGPLTFLKQHFLPRRMRVPLHQRLQSAADRGLPVLRSAGFGYVVMACKERARARG